MKIRFTKMHGLGNDFVVIDNTEQRAYLTSEHMHFIADRHFGVGCDQILLIEPPDSEAVDFVYRIFNADGSEVGQCGNGARCFARYVHDRGLTSKKNLTVKTASGIIKLTIAEHGEVSVNMGTPEFSPDKIPIAAQTQQNLYTLDIGGQSVRFGAVSMGNPHAVLRVDELDKAPVAALGAQLETHPFFPERANIGFMQIINRQRIRLRVFERGAGETLACGTGACAAMVIAHQQNLVDNSVRLSLPGGDLSIVWPGGHAPVVMTGPTSYVFDGQITLTS